MIKKATNFMTTKWLQHALLLALLISLFSQPVLAQEEPVTIVWDKTFGGVNTDQISSQIKTPDGGYLLGGYSNSGASGDKTEDSRGSVDYWVVKINADGSKAWDKTYGGDGGDYLRSMAVTPDGGFLLGGYSNSNISGDKTEADKGWGDYWVVKINADGNKIWDKTFGGSLGDQLNSLTVTPDGGFLLGGFSRSGVYGDKTEASKGGDDFWVVKVNGDGNKVWDKSFGGSGNDLLYSLTTTPDGGYMLGGHSESGADGDKTEASKGGSDYWVVKINTDGSKAWDKTYGGSGNDYLSSMVLTTDGGYLLGGSSDSRADGDKTENQKGWGDYWVVKINADGSKAWDNTIGGGGSDQLFSLATTVDGGYLLGGQSESPISGDKTEASKGGTDYWVVKIDADGSKAWDKTYGGSNGFENMYSLIKTDDGSYLLGGRSSSKAGEDKSEDGRGGYDYWVVKIKEPGLSGTTTYAMATVTEGWRHYNNSGTFYLVGGDFTEPYNGIAVKRDGDSGYETVTGFDPGTGVNGAVYAVADNYGSFIIAGDFTTYNGTTVNRVARLNIDGTLDPAFNAGAGPNGAVRAINNNGGSIIIVGDFTDYNGTPVNGIARLNTDGSLDTSFNTGTGANGPIYTISEMGALYIGGDFTSYNGTPINRVARLNADGSLDTSFDPGTGANGPVYTVHEESDIYIGGAFTSFNGVERNRFAGVSKEGQLLGSGELANKYYPEGGFSSPVRTITRAYYQLVVGGEFGVIEVDEEGNKYNSETGIKVFDSQRLGQYGVIAAGDFGIKVVTSPYSISVEQVSPGKVRPGDEYTVHFYYGGVWGPNTYFETGYWMENGSGSSTAQVLATVQGEDLYSKEQKINVRVPVEMENGSYRVFIRSRNPDVEEIFTDDVRLEVAPTEWKGGAFGNDGSWTLGVPNENTDAIIKGSATLSSGSFSARNFTIAEGATFRLSSGGTLNVRKNFVNNGTFEDGGGILNTGYIGGENITELQNFTVRESGTTLAGPVAISGILTLIGNLTTNNETLMLQSDASGTAYVNNEGGEVVGKATMERFIDPTFNVGPGYRHFSSPVASTTLQDMVTENYTPVLNPEYNTAEHPYSVKPFPNVFGYDQSRLNNTNATTSGFDFGWYSPSSLSSALEPGKGYSVNIPATAKVALSGTLNNGNITVSGLGNSGMGSASGWHLLGNPYPSPIDWTLLNRPAGIDNAIYVYRSSGQYAGTYAAFINGIGDSDARYIAPMQGFFIHANANGQSLTFTNDARIYDEEPVLYRTTEQRPQLQLKLIGKGGLADEAYVYFQEGATTAVNGQFDAYKVLTYNTDRPTLFARLGQDAISIKGFPLDNASHSLPLEFYVTESGSYTFSVAKLVNFPAAAQVQLLDRETSESHDLSQSKEITLALNTTTDPHRFVLSFSAVAGSPLSIDELAAGGVEAILYPNPSQGDVNLVLSGLQASPEKVELVLYNTLGQQVLRRQVSAAEAQAGVRLTTSAFAKGVYHLHIQAAGKALTRKLVLSK